MTKKTKTFKHLLALTEINQPSERFDWFDALDTMQHRKAKSAVEITERSTLYWRLQMRASLWPTCACGQLCKGLPRNGTGEGAGWGTGAPTDNELIENGTRFLDVIYAEEWSTARRIMRAIEKRTTVLLRAQATQARKGENVCR